MTRREFIAACIALAAASLAWDAGVNRGRPGCAEEEDEEPPNFPTLRTLRSA